MDPSMVIPLSIAGGCVLVALIVHFSRSSSPSEPALTSTQAAIRNAVENREKDAAIDALERATGGTVVTSSRKSTNKRGWKAPAGHYFNDADELVDDAGDLILDMLLIAELCGVNDALEEVVDETVEPQQLSGMEMDTVGSETIASLPETHVAVKEETAPPIEPATPEPVSVSAFEDTKSYSGRSDFSDTSYGGGDDGGGGGDDGGGD